MKKELHLLKSRKQVNQLTGISPMNSKLIFQKLMSKWKIAEKASNHSFQELLLAMMGNNLNSVFEIMN